MLSPAPSPTPSSMKERIVEWVKGETIVRKTENICDCGGDYNYVGLARCVHDDWSTPIYQCCECKLVIIGRIQERADWDDVGGWIRRLSEI